MAQLSLVHAQAPCLSRVFHCRHGDGAGKLSQHLTELCPPSARLPDLLKHAPARPACCKRWFLSASRASARLVASAPRSLLCHGVSLSPQALTSVGCGVTSKIAAPSAEPSSPKLHRTSFCFSGLTTSRRWRNSTAERRAFCASAFRLFVFCACRQAQPNRSTRTHQWFDESTQLSTQTIVPIETQGVFCIATGSTGLDHTPSALCTLQILPLQVLFEQWHLCGSATSPIAAMAPGPCSLEALPLQILPSLGGN